MYIVSQTFVQSSKRKCLLTYVCRGKETEHLLGLTPPLGEIWIFQNPCRALIVLLVGNLESNGYFLESVM